jgi:hypothetical protein
MSVTATLDLEAVGEETVARSGIEVNAGSLFMKALEGVIANTAAGELATGLERLRDAIQQA